MSCSLVSWEKSALEQILPILMGNIGNIVPQYWKAVQEHVTREKE